MAGECRALSLALNDFQESLKAPMSILEEQLKVKPLLEDILKKMNCCPDYEKLDLKEFNSAIFSPGKTLEDGTKYKGLEMTALGIKNSDFAAVRLFMDNTMAFDVIQRGINSQINELQGKKDKNRVQDLAYAISEGDKNYQKRDDFKGALIEFGISKKLHECYIADMLCDLGNFLAFKTTLFRLVVMSIQKNTQEKEFTWAFNDLKQHFSELFDRLQMYFNMIEQSENEMKEIDDAINNLVELMRKDMLKNELKIRAEFKKLGGVYPEYLKIVLQDIEREYNATIETETSEYDKTPIRKYLFDHGVDYRSIGNGLVEGIELYDKDFVERVLKIMDYAAISCYDIFNSCYSAFVMLTGNDLEFLEDLIDRRLLTGGTLSKRMSSISDGIQVMKFNYELLGSFINFNNEYEVDGFNDELLFQDEKMLIGSIWILKQYTSVSKDILIYLLSHMDKIVLLDRMLENNVELSLFMDIAKSFNPDVVFKRILISREIGEPYCDANGLLKTIREARRFIVPDDDLSDYLVKDYDSVGITSGLDELQIVDNNMVEDFDRKYRIKFGSSDLYNIGGVLFSRPKFIKHLALKKDSFDALVIGSIMTTEDVEMVQRVIGDEWVM